MQGKEVRLVSHVGRIGRFVCVEAGNSSKAGW